MALLAATIYLKKSKGKKSMQHIAKYLHKKIANAVLFSFLFSVISPAVTVALEPIKPTAQELLFQHLANCYLKSFDQITPAQEQSLEELVKNNETIELQKVELSDAEKRQLAFNMLAQHSAYKNTNIGPVIDKNFVIKMELLCGGDNGKISLFSHINRTHTVFGEAALARLLAQPVTDISTLKARQAIIKELVENEELFNHLDAELQKIKQVEHYMLSYWKEENKINAHLAEKLYYGKWMNMLNLNQSSTALEVGTRLDNTLRTLTLLEAPLFIGIAGGHALVHQEKARMEAWRHSDPKKAITTWQAVKKGLASGVSSYAFGLSFLLDQRKRMNTITSTYLDSNIQSSKEAIARGSRWNYKDGVLEATKDLSKFENLKTSFDKSGCDESFWKLAQEHNITEDALYTSGQIFPVNMRQLFAQIDAQKDTMPQPWTPSRLKLAIGGILGTLLLFKAYTTRAIVNEELLRQKVTNNIHEHMIGVATYVDAMKTMQNLGTQARHIATHVPSLASLDELDGVSKKHSKNFNYLCSLLTQSTFEGRPSFFSRTGSVLAAHQVMKEVKDELVPALEAAGELDAYLSVAKLYKEYAAKRVKYTFVDYVSSKTPSLELSDFWNPFVNSEVVIANDFSMDSMQGLPNNALITGPNTGGKSTVLKGIILCILLAQTLGIAPARAIKLTPFANINCYLNVTDDIAAGTSLFKAEVLRAKALINAIQALRPTEFSFTIMDEVFSGTSPKEGEEAAYMFAEQLGKFPNSMLLLATHFPKLTELETATSVFKNYQVKVIRESNGSLTRPYKLEAGKSFINVAMDLLKEEGIFFK